MYQPGQIVVIIDDDESVRRALGRLLRSVGLKVDAFATAEDFLKSNQQAPPACLIVDVHLPGMSGLDLQKHLGATGRKHPVVFITAYGDEQMRVAALHAGAIAFLSKPFDEQALLTAVARAVG
jgi:FixJ family two-component response regulator